MHFNITCNETKTLDFGRNDTDAKVIREMIRIPMRRALALIFALTIAMVFELSQADGQATGASKTNTSPSPDTKGSADKNSFRTYEQYALRHAGNPANGRKLFDDKRTKCAVCHKIAGKGGDVGVDLSQIGGKFDRPHLIESLLEPSRQIVEGYRTANLMTVDGELLSGIIKKQSDEQLTIVDADAKQQVVKRDDIEELTHSSVSIMPAGLAKELSLDEFTDLIAYLESLRPGHEKRGAGIVGPISLPDDFELRTVVTGLDGATALEVLPDGRVLVCEQLGRVRVIENGKMLDEPFVTLPVDAYWERGVIGVTYDPSFPAKPYIYVCWVAKEPYPHHHISRFTMKGNVAIEGSEKLLLVGDDQTKMGGKVPAGHQGGAVHFGNDGKLYIAIGEQTAEKPSQSLDSFLGKILRINADGSIPEDNPFCKEAKGKYRAIWARGSRNPFTFAFRQPDGLMLINDVGGSYEEVNVGRSGANFGWPTVDHGDEARYQVAEFDGPIHSYIHSSINGAAFCPVESPWPKHWRGRYFFADYIHGWIHTLDPDNPSDVDTFVEGMRRPVDLRFAPDGSLYVLLRNAWVIDDKFQNETGSLLQIRTRGKIVKHVAPLSEKAMKAGPRPGDVYREYAIHNGGNLDWRVTDPNAKHKGAQAFLPNPILNLNIRDLNDAIRAEAVLDRWGGHAGTKQKLIRFNGSDWITLPELTTTPAGHDPERYHSQDNPVVAVPLEHLRKGDNVLEGMIGPKNESSWGQWGLYSLILRVYYDPEKKRHATGKIVSPAAGATLGENPTIELQYDQNAERIDVLAWYDGYDEDGNGVFKEWHGTRFQPFRGKAADLQDHVGTIDPSSAERELTWKTRWVPDQQPKAIKLIARVQSNDDLIYVTDTVDGLSLKREGFSVKQFRATDVPEVFSVRVGQTKSCNIPIAATDDLGAATEAVLHYRTWEAHDGHHEPFELNGHKHLNEGKNHHYDYDLLPIPIAELKSGDNTFTIQSETEHHMLEVLWPGPAITVRFRTDSG